MTWDEKYSIRGNASSWPFVSFSRRLRNNVTLPSGAQTDLEFDSGVVDNFDWSGSRITYVGDVPRVILISFYASVNTSGTNVDLVMVKNEVNIWYNQVETAGSTGSIIFSTVVPEYMTPGDNLGLKCRPFGSSGVASYSLSLSESLEAQNVGS